MPQKKTKQPMSQLEKFKETAHQLECNPSEAEFEKTLRKLARTKPQPKTTKRAKTKAPRKK